jgi:acetyltransferase-like isoleucine patch superfamily enzyme
MLLAEGGYIIIGNNCSVNPYTILYGHGGLTIGNWVRIAAHTTMIPANHIFADRSQPISKQGLTRQGIVIEDDVWVGANATVLDGAHISAGCVIAAGAVVKGRTEPFGVYAGVPARLIGMRGQAGAQGT